MTVRAVIFDAGGTLVRIDPARLGPRLAARGLPVPPDGVFAEAHYRAMADWDRTLEAGGAAPFSWWAERFFTHAGVEVSAGLIAAFAGGEGMWVLPCPGAREAVVRLRAAGYRVAVVSNSDGSVAESLETAGFGGLFEFVIDSHLVGVAKPDPAILDLALDRLGLAADDALYVGDSAFHDLGAARRAGLAAGVLVDPLGLGPPDAVRVPAVAMLDSVLEAAPGQ